MTMTAVGNKLIIFGGWSPVKGQHLGDVWSGEPDITGVFRWHKVDPMLAPLSATLPERSRHKWCSVFAGGKEELFLFGGV